MRIKLWTFSKMKPIYGFVGRAIHSFIFENEIGETKGKGVPKAMLKKCIRHEP